MSKYISFKLHGDGVYRRSKLVDCLSLWKHSNEFDELNQTNQDDIIKLSGRIPQTTVDGYRAFKFSEFTNYEDQWILIPESNYEINDMMKEFDSCTSQAVCNCIRGVTATVNKRHFYKLDKHLLSTKTKNPVQGNWDSEYMFVTEDDVIVTDNINEACQKLNIGRSTAYFLLSGDYDEAVGIKGYYKNGGIQNRSRSKHTGNYKVRNTHTGEEKEIDNLNEFAKNNDLTQSALVLTAKGLNEQHQGWEVDYIE